MKRTYDFVFSLGAACACTECLRMAGLQFSSFPFDWLAGSTLEKRTDILVDGSPDWLRTDALEYLKPVSVAHTDAYRNNATGIVFNHDFPQDVPLSESIAAVREKYERRFVRLRDLLSRGGRVLAVYITPWNAAAPTDEDAAYCRHRLSERFPMTSFDVLVLKHGENTEPIVVYQSEGVIVVAFDYRNRADTTGANPIDRDRVVRFLKRQGCAAVDYRSKAERRAHRAAGRATEYRKFGVTNGLGWLWVRLQYKLYVHLRKRMMQRGVA